MITVDECAKMMFDSNLDNDTYISTLIKINCPKLHREAVSKAMRMICNQNSDNVKNLNNCIEYIIQERDHFMIEDGKMYERGNVAGIFDSRNKIFQKFHVDCDHYEIARGYFLGFASFLSDQRFGNSSYRDYELKSFSLSERGCFRILKPNGNFHRDIQWEDHLVVEAYSELVKWLKIGSKTTHPYSFEVVEF